MKNASNALCAGVLCTALTVASCTGSTDVTTTSQASPLVVSSSSHVVIMEYESLYGPNAVTIDGSDVYPTLTSVDMTGHVCGTQNPCGYDSTDPAIISQHVAWLQELGIDAVTIDISNGAPCAFQTNSWYQTIQPSCTAAAQSGYQAIASNGANLYPAFTRAGTNIKLIPELDGQDPNLLLVDPNTGKTALELEMAYFANLMDNYPAMSVVYQGNPLMVLFVGPVPCITGYSTPCAPLVSDIQAKIHAAGFDSRFTFRFVAGYLDAQSGLWDPSHPNPPTGPVMMSPNYLYWSWVDRFYPTPYGYFPAYNVVNGKVENFTVSVATIGAEVLDPTSYQNCGWGTYSAGTCTVLPDAALRSNVQLFLSSMTNATSLAPTFLLVHQFNEYGPPGGDEGWDADTTDGIEPTNATGLQTFNMVKSALADYKAAVAGK